MADFKADLAAMQLLKELKAEKKLGDPVTSIELEIDRRISEINSRLGFVHILNNVLGEEKIKQLINDNQKCWMDWGYTYEGGTRVNLPVIEINFSLVDGKGDSVICLTVCYRTESGKWEREFGNGKMYDTYEQMGKEEFEHDGEEYFYYHDNGVIYL